MEPKEDDRVVDKVAHSLAAEFPQVPTEKIDSLVRESVSMFSGRPVRDYIPVLVTKDVRTRLRQTSSGIRP